MLTDTSYRSTQLRGSTLLVCALLVHCSTEDGGALQAPSAGSASMTAAPNGAVEGAAGQSAVNPGVAGRAGANGGGEPVDTSPPLDPNRPDDETPTEQPVSMPPSGAAWSPEDISFTSTTDQPNPYMDVTDFTVTFNGPDRAELTVPGFYIGEGVWKVRFAPTGPGTFTYVTSSAQDPSLDGLTGTVAAARANGNAHGAIRVDPAHPHHYVYEDGSRYFQMAYELDWLGLMDFGDPNITKARTLIDMIASNGFSEVIMNAFAYDTSWEMGTTSEFDFGPPAEFAWAGSNANPDHSRMNEAYWEGYDRVIAYLFEKGITAHIFFKVYNKQVNWPGNNSAEEDLYFKFVTARYQAYSNVVWDFSKESFYERDQAYIADRLNLIKATDAYQRLRTLHDSDGGQSQHPNYYDVASHAGTVDFYTDQQDNQYRGALTAWNERAMPYLNAEVILYQIGNDGSSTYGDDSKEATFEASMEVIMAGGYFAYYYTLQAWDVVRWGETPDSIGWYANVSRFMRSTRWYELSPNDALIGGGSIGTHCLADAGKQYIVYKRAAGGVTLDVAGAATPLAAKWVNLQTGAEAELPEQSNGSRSFDNPWSVPALLYLSSPAS